MTQKLLSTQAATDWVLYKLDGGLSHVLLDEAQDTSPAQWDLIGSLTREFTAGQGIEKPQDPRTLFVVCLLYTSPSPRDQRGSRMPSSA